MRKIVILMFCLIASVAVYAQSNNNNDDEVVKIDQMNRFNSVDGEVIVKFADNSSFGLKYDRDNKLQSTGIAAVDKVFKKYDFVSIERLCPNDDPKRELRISKSYNGGDVVERDLSRLCLVKINSKDGKTVTDLIDEFNAMDEVEFAEPNYIAYALGTLPDNKVEDENDNNDKHGGNNSGGYKDPFISQQWGLFATHVNELWSVETSEEQSSDRPVIAILDTGVDITHPDLEANIWTNPDENDNGYDNDGNGFVGDIHGWDFVNKTNKIDDYNSHGTHCAGIAAAVGGNNKGVVGANPNAYIMPVTVMQSNGSGSISTIIQGINYAANNGADIISMSIGTYAYSIALEQALAQAYQNSVLVAAAGNDGLGIDPKCSLMAALCYPAAFTFVLGVEATQFIPDYVYGCGYRACFSNYDCDGPSFSQYSEEQLYNYELQAPGVSIISTVPDGKYKYFNGTSMACPLVAGGVSALLKIKDYPSQELLWGDLINTSGNHVDFMACYEAGPAPAQLQFVCYELNDTIDGDNDSRPDAGETLTFYPTIRTTWGAADDITYWLELDEYEDETTIEFIQNDNIDFGHSLSAYAKSKAANPVIFKVNENVVDGRYINMVLKATCPDAQETLEYPFTIQVENGVELKGLITENTTLYPDVHYIVTGALGIQEGVTLTIMPGTTIRFKDNVTLSNNGRIVAIGEPDNMITFTKTELGYSGYTLELNYKDIFSYCVIEYANQISPKANNPQNTYYYCYYPEDEEFDYFAECLNKTGVDNIGITYYKIIIIDNSILRYGRYISSDLNIINTNILYNTGSDYQIEIPNYSSRLWTEDLKLDYGNNIIGNVNYCCSGSREYSFTGLGNIFGNRNGSNIVTTGTDMITIPINGTYLGSSKDEIISSHIYDIETPNSTSLNDVLESTAARRPFASAHGIVWKVLVNGKDAQDEFDEVTPLGVGRHKFEVYFNRAMDVATAPMVAMGVRPPYTQNAIAQDGSWSADSTIYTVYIDIDGSTVTDGLNRIYVANALDNEHFEIPIENRRFNVQVAAAGSMSTGFEATPGIGKVDLAWENDSTYFNDHLGWNMYRYQKDERGNTDTILINTEMITDTIFTDFDVIPGERYYYFYKAMRTNLTESEASTNVSVVPLTAQPGDANGNLEVNVADIVTVVNYITGDMPQPFIFDAADVNGDGEIDVMDIVAIVNIIINGKYEVERTPVATATYSIEDGILYVDTPVELGGVQVYVTCYDEDDIEILGAMDKFEQVAQFVADGRYMFMAYSLSGETLSPGKHAIMRINYGEMDEMILADADGNNVLAVEETLGFDTENEIYVLNAPYPNPFNNSINIPYMIGDKSGSISLTITNVMGQEVANINLGTHSRGKYSYEWKPKSDVPTGIYIINMYVNGNMIQRNRVVYMK